MLSFLNGDADRRLSSAGNKGEKTHFKQTIYRLRKPKATIKTFEYSKTNNQEEEEWQEEKEYKEEEEGYKEEEEKEEDYTIHTTHHMFSQVGRARRGSRQSGSAETWNECPVPGPGVTVCLPSPCWGT